MPIADATEGSTGGVELILATESVVHARARIVVLCAELEVKSAVAGLEVDVGDAVVGVADGGLLLLGRVGSVVSVATVVFAGGVEIPVAFLQLSREGGVDESVHTGGHSDGSLMAEDVVLFAVVGARDDVDCTGEGVESEDVSGRPLQHFDTLDEIGCDRQVERVVAGVRVGEVDAIDHDEHLIECAASHGDISLRAIGATSTHINPRQISKDIGYGLDGERLDLGMRNLRYQSVGL